MPATFAAVDKNGCAMQGDRPSRLVNYADLPIVLVAHGDGHVEQGARSSAGPPCGSRPAPRRAAVYLPDRGLAGRRHFAMAQLDNAAYAKVFIELATAIDSAAKN